MHGRRRQRCGQIRVVVVVVIVDRGGPVRRLLIVQGFLTWSFKRNRVGGARGALEIGRLVRIKRGHKGRCCGLLLWFGGNIHGRQGRCFGNGDTRRGGWDSVDPGRRWFLRPLVVLGRPKHVLSGRRFGVQKKRTTTRGFKGFRSRILLQTWTRTGLVFTDKFVLGTLGRQDGNGCIE